MGEEFYCILKLISGEEILSLIMVEENNDETIIILQNPVILSIFTNKKETYIKIKPWIEFSNDNFFIIKLDKVITMTETKDDKLIDLYNTYVKETDNMNYFNYEGSVKMTKKMGYLGSVDEARKSLEEIFKYLKDT